ncbi:unnamed protein product, partial [Cuscuta campestris]
EALQNLVVGDFGKVRLADDSALEVTGMGDMVLKTSVGFWTLKDVRVVPALKKSLISVRQLDEQGHEVKFRDGQWKVVKGNLVMARGRKSGSLYLVELPSEGVTAPVQKRNKVRFTESCGQNKVVYAREKPNATGQTRDERARKGSRRPVRGIYGSGSSRGASAKLPRRQWVRRTSIPAVGTSPEIFLLSMESVCSQDVPGSGSVRLQWEPVGTEDESVADLVMTDVLELGRASTSLSVNERGQVDVWSEKCLPPGTVHLPLPRISLVAKRLEIDYAPAMVGFDFRNGRSVPLFEGIVVCAEFKDAILEAYGEEEERRKAEERRRREAQALSKWYQLLSSIVTRQRLNNAYASGGPSDAQNPSESSTMSMKATSIRPHERKQEKMEKKLPLLASKEEEDQHEHEHVFFLEDDDDDDGTRMKRCRCGFSIQFEEL